MFGRKNKYREVVAAARQAAAKWYWTPIVYQNLESRWWNNIPKYSFCNRVDFDRAFKTGNYAWVRLLMILPDGTIAQ